MEYIEDGSGLAVRGETFDYLWSMRGYGLLMEDCMSVVYTPLPSGAWVYMSSIKPDDLRIKIEDDIRSLIEDGVLKKS